MNNSATFLLSVFETNVHFKRRVHSHVSTQNMASKASALIILYQKFHPSPTRTVKMILMMATVMRGDMMLVPDRSVSQHSRHMVCLCAPRTHRTRHCAHKHSAHRTQHSRYNVAHSRLSVGLWIFRHPKPGPTLTSGYTKISFSVVLIMSVRVTFDLVNASKMDEATRS